MGHIELVARLLERLAPRCGLLHTLGGQVGVKPATEPDAETLLGGTTLLIEDLHTCVLMFSNIDIVVVPSYSHYSEKAPLLNMGVTIQNAAARVRKDLHGHVHLLMYSLTGIFSKNCEYRCQNWKTQCAEDRTVAAAPVSHVPLALPVPDHHDLVGGHPEQL